MLNQQEENISLIALFSINVHRNELECHCIISLPFFLLLNDSLLAFITSAVYFITISESQILSDVTHYSKYCTNKQ